MKIENGVRVIKTDDVERLETGPTRIDYGIAEDWPGVFIRGDNAFGYALSLQQVLPHIKDPIVQIQLEGLLRVLQSSRVK